MTAPSARVASAASVLFLLGLLSACTDAEPSARAVAVVQADALVRVTGEEQWLQTPLGQVAVTFGDPTTTTVDGTQAGSGEVFVPFKVEDRSDDGVPALILDLMDATAPSPEVSLRVGRESIRLGTTFTTSRTGSTLDERAAYLRVPEDEADDLSLQVEFDGQSQTVSQDGVREPALASLYRKKTEVVSACEDWSVAERPSRDVFSLWCTAAGLRYPYVPGFGWVEDGEDAWAAITVTPQFVPLVVGRNVFDQPCASVNVRSVNLDLPDRVQPKRLPLGESAGVVFQPVGERWPRATATVKLTCNLGTEAVDLTLSHKIDLNRPKQATRP